MGLFKVSNIGACMSIDRFEVLISDDLFDFKSFYFEDVKITGAEIADIFGAHPVEEFRIYVQLYNLELEELRRSEKVEISERKTFFVIRGDADYSFVVDGINLVWPKEINGAAIKKLIKVPLDKELYLEKKETSDVLINNDDIVSISATGLEKLYTQEKAACSFEIIVEGTPHLWSKKDISYEEVVSLEVPDYSSHPEVTYSVKYKNGPGVKPEGILSKGASVKVKNGMVFNVSETGQS